MRKRTARPRPLLGGLAHARQHLGPKVVDRAGKDDAPVASALVPHVEAMASAAGALRRAASGVPCLGEKLPADVTRLSEWG